MCLWLLTACLGLLPSNPSSNIVIVQGVPAPIVVPTAAATTATVTPLPTVTIATVTQTVAPVTLPTSGSTSTARTSTTRTSTTRTSTTRTTTTTAGVMRLPVILCNSSDVVCVANPDDDAGSLPIDPRLGTTPGTPAALQVPPITAYSAQNQNDMSVRFPRTKRSLESNLLDLLRGNDKNFGTHKISKRQSCVCVSTGTCNRGANGGAGQIDIRIVQPGGSAQCPAGQEYCCTGTSTTPQNTVACGIRQAVPALAITPAAGQAYFGQYPWQALVLTRQNDYIAGGVLINNRNVITVTHRMVNYVVSGTAPNVKIRLGEWDAAGTYEPLPFQEYQVTRVFSHPSYNPNTLQYDIMVLRLGSAVPFTPAAGSVPSINRACLPSSATSTYVGQRCWVSGWGRNMFGIQGQYQQILKEVDVPIVAPATCQAQMRAARLGPSFNLDTTSFICAGGEANRDSCTGDGGSGLVCQVNGQWVVVGLVAWGLGCGSANVPAAYVNIAALLPWIQQQVATA